MASPDVPFDRFLRYEELTDVLHSLADAHPDLLTVESIGKSHEGRDIWLCTLTDTTAGPADEKPALWVDANIHATELTGSVAALHLVHRLVSGFANGDERVRRALRSRACYVVPRINPDGAEWALDADPRYIRSSTRAWPRTEQQDGLVARDVDGDGRILQMRIEDPNGPWKPDTEDRRLLVARDPDEDGPGPYYRVVPEGVIEGWIEGFDGDALLIAPPLQGLDLNRNFPVDWRTAAEQAGAGPYPTSEPEIRAIVQAVVDRPNLVHYIAYHTYTGVHLRPYGHKDDDALPTFDLERFKDIGRKATSLTGYPAVSVFHNFKYDPKEVITGVADDWAYDHLGLYAWTTEFWSPLRAAGIEVPEKPLEWFEDHPIEDERKVLAWSDDELGGEGFVDWYPFEHPQLGRVELGGFYGSYWWRNPPPDRLEAEIAPHSEWALWLMLVTPLLRIRRASAVALGDSAWRVRVVVENAGWLPTNGSQKALDRKAVRDLEVKLLPSEGVAVEGRDRVEVGQLTGRAGKKSAVPATADPTTDRAVVDFTVRSEAGRTVTVEARHQRAGVVRCEVELLPAEPPRALQP